MTCRIASRSTTTRVPHSATTAAACCGACTDKGSSAKVGSHCFLFLSCEAEVAFCACVANHFRLLTVSYLFFFARSTLRTDCGMNVHSNCQKKVANLCGINQKLLAEALCQVSQVCTLTCCVNLRGGEIPLFIILFIFICGSIFFPSLCVSFFSFFRNLPKSLTTQIQQTLESTKMCALEQQTLVVRCTHCSCPQLNNKHHALAPQIFNLSRKNSDSCVIRFGTVSVLA